MGTIRFEVFQAISFTLTASLFTYLAFALLHFLIKRARGKNKGRFY